MQVFQSITCKLQIIDLSLSYIETSHPSTTFCNKFIRSYLLRRDLAFLTTLRGQNVVNRLFLVPDTNHRQ